MIKKKIILGTQNIGYDINLNQSQEIIGGGSWTYTLQDYSLHTFYGSPSSGQTLEQVKDLLLMQIEELKSGNFLCQVIYLAL